MLSLLGKELLTDQASPLVLALSEKNESYIYILMVRKTDRLLKGQNSTRFFPRVYNFFQDDEKKKGAVASPSKS